MRYNVICKRVLDLSQKFNRVKYFYRDYSDDRVKTRHDFNPLRKKIRRRFDDEIKKFPNRICLTVIGNGAVGQPRCVCMFTDIRSYMFNCGEGTSRITREHDLRICDIRDVFITRKSWENVSGLSDVYQTHRTSGIPKLRLHGPPGIEDFNSVVSSEMKNVLIAKRDLNRSPFMDDIVVIDYVPAHNNLTENTKNINYRYQGISDTDKGESGEVVVSYICRVLAKPGELMPEKCIEHGVPLGPLLLDLKNGKDVTLASGKVVHNKDICSAELPGSVFLVVDCPFESMLHTFVTEEKFKMYQSPNNEAEEVSVVFHFSPTNVVQTQLYQQWLNRFHPNALHVMLNTDNSTLNSEVIHKVQCMLHLLHPGIFKLLKEHPGSKPCVAATSTTAEKQVIYADSLLQYYLRPYKKLDRYNVVNLNPECFMEEAMNIPGFWDELKLLQEEKKKITNEILEGSEYPKVLFLGTGSSFSTAYRNVSAILVRVNSNCSILVDCGDGTYSQLLRYFGYSDIGSVLQSISCIFTSHHHTDHYIGLFQIIKARKEAFMSSGKQCVPVAVTANVITERNIHMFQKKFESFKADIRVFKNSSLKIGENNASDTFKKFIGNIELDTVAVKHCYDAYGLVLSEENKWKIVYSGDTVPCQKLIDAGKDCTLLIHEATLEDVFDKEANLKNHSTPSQAVEVAEKMNAKYTILTHFSQRYLNVPPLPEYKSNVGIAFDNMEVCPSTLPLLPLFIPALKCLFSDLLDIHLEKTIDTMKKENVFLKSIKI